jgi:hypothetical protein
LVIRGNIRGIDILDLADSSKKLRDLSFAQDQAIFRKLLLAEFNVKNLKNGASAKVIYRKCLDDYYYLIKSQNKITKIGTLIIDNLVEFESMCRKDFDRMPYHPANYAGANDIFELLYDPRNAVQLTDKNAVRGPFWEHRAYNENGLTHNQIEFIWKTINIWAKERTRIKIINACVSGEISFDEIQKIYRGSNDRAKKFLPCFQDKEKLF